MRCTVQQEVIVRTLEKMHTHPTADEVYRAVSEEMPSIGKATVYRVLNKLSEKGDVTKVRVNNGADHFDHKVHEHSHVVCSLCGKVEDVDLTLPDELAKKAQQLPHGFKLTGHGVQFDGICPECQRKMGGEE